jgi:DNA-binding NtrC family response regulator
MENDGPLVLVVDDEPASRDVLEMRVESWGFRVCTAGDATEAERVARARRPDMVVTDVVLPDRSGVELLRTLRGLEPSLPVILMTAHGTVDLAVEAIKAGAQDFLTKPLNYAQLQALLEAGRSSLRRRAQARELVTHLDENGGLGPWLRGGPRMTEIFELVKLVASKDTTALITGESGTGKELVARTIHELSARRKGPFVAVNTAAMPESLIESELFGHERGAFTGAAATRVGMFELANGGTLLLDEIAEMPIALQPKLLRVLEERTLRRVGGSAEIKLDVRVIAATNREPQVSIAEGRLRHDLFYRLGVFAIELPPLRDRPEEIPLLTQHFIRRFNEKHGTEVEGVSEAALERMEQYGWPGNVRELSNVIERCAIVAGTGWIEAAHLPPYLKGEEGPGSRRVVLPFGITAAEAEKRLILKTLEMSGYNKAEAARRLDIDVKTLRNKLKAWGDG